MEHLKDGQCLGPFAGFSVVFPNIPVFCRNHAILDSDDVQMTHSVLFARFPTGFPKENTLCFTRTWWESGLVSCSNAPNTENRTDIDPISSVSQHRIPCFTGARWPLRLRRGMGGQHP